MDATSDYGQVARLEEQLAAVLNQAVTDVNHTDCLDDEQRSEIYTIIQAMKADTDEHRVIIGRFVSDRKGAAHA